MSITNVLLSKMIRQNNWEREIYGGEWNKGSIPVLTRTHNAAGCVANAGVGFNTVVNDFDNRPIFGEIIDVTDSLGNTFVRIPKVYVRKLDGSNFKSWQVSKTRYPGFYLPWCFWDFVNSKELPYIDIGKYKASLGAGNKLESKPNTYPLINTHIVNMRTYARNNNAGGLSGYQQLDMHTYDIIQSLFYAEFATLDSQSVMQGYTTGQYTATHLATVAELATNRIVVANAYADLYRVGQAISVGTSLGGNQIFYGRTITAIDVYDASNKALSFDGATVNIAVGNVLYNTGWKNGFSAGIAASSGSIVSNSDGKYPCVYRGIESPWGDVWQFVDGVNVDGGVTWVTGTAYTPGQIVIGTTAGTTYRCTVGHTSADETKPSTGANWATVWELHAHRRAWVAKNAADYASNVFASPYEQLGYVNHNANNYVLEMGHDPLFPFAEFPTSVGLIDNSAYKDYYYQDSGQRIALVGGSWSRGADAGVSYWSLSYASSPALVSLGGRLVRKAV